jgi:hypothetical protein
VFVTVTVAFGTMAPEASVTVPVMPLRACPGVSVEKTVRRKAAAKERIQRDGRGRTFEFKLQSFG